MSEDYIMQWNDTPIDFEAKKRIEEEKKRNPLFQEVFVKVLLFRLDKFPPVEGFIESLKDSLWYSKINTSRFCKVYAIACALDAILGRSVLQQELEIRNVTQTLMDAVLNPASDLYKALNIQRKYHVITCSFSTKGITLRWKNARSLRDVHRVLDEYFA